MAHFVDFVPDSGHRNEDFARQNPEKKHATLCGQFMTWEMIYYISVTPYIIYFNY